MSRKFEIKNSGEKKLKFENLKYYNLIRKVYDRFDGEDYTESSMGVDYIFYNTLIKYILKHKPKFILELGSGYTTYLMGTLIQDYNLDTKLLSLENEKNEYLILELLLIGLPVLLRSSFQIQYYLSY